MKLSSILLGLAFIFMAYLLIGCAWNLTQAGISHPCRQLSERLEDSLESIGIPVTICCGWNSTDNYTNYGHMYIRIYGIPIDSTTLFVWIHTYQGCDCYTGEWSDMEDYYEDYPSHRD